MKSFRFNHLKKYGKGDQNLNQSSKTPRTRRNNVIYALEMLRAKSHVLKALMDYRVVQFKALHDAGKYDPITYGWVKGRISVVSEKLTKLYAEVDNLEKELQNHGNDNQ
jgi:hypothetical protein